MTISTRHLVMMTGVAGALAAQTVTTNPARATDANAVHDGKELAASLCAPCHNISARAAEERTATPAGPSFAEIAQSAKADATTLRGFLHTTHSNVAHPGAMPNPQLTETQITALAAYLASLRRTR